MKEIIKLILKHHFTIIFILLEIVSFSLIVQHNKYQRTVFSGYTASVFGYLSSCSADVHEYMYLRELNEKLVEENTELKNKVERLKENYSAIDSTYRFVDTLTATTFTYQFAKVCNATFNKTKNYITLDKGSDNGFKKEMAVCSKDGVVGVIQNTSSHYTVVLPLLNVNLRVSAKVKKNGYYGSLQWDGNDYRFSSLNDIPFHVSVEKGDTIVTSGFSSIFPEGEVLGFIENVDRETANFLSIKIRLAVDFKKLSDVYVIDNIKKGEQKQLEKASFDEK